MARRRPGRRAPSRPGRMADRPDAGTARRRVRGRSGEPGGRLVGLPDHKPIADGGGNPSRGDPRGDPRRSRCTAEVVLAHRHCPSEPHSHALPRTRLDATIGFLRGLRSHREDLPHDRQQPTHGAGTVVAGPAVAIVTRTGISLDEVQQALRVLTTSPSFFEVVSPTRPISSVVRPTARALQVAGAWPSPEALLTNLVAAINNAADDAAIEPQTRSKLAEVAAFLGATGWQVAIAALGGADGNLLSG